MKTSNKQSAASSRSTGKAASPTKGKQEAKQEAKQEELATTPGGALSQSAILDDLIGDAGMGGSEFSKEDLAIPRLTILQALSPQCQKRETTYIEGAEAGEIFDTVSSAIFSGQEGIHVIPCTYRRTNIEWKPRDAGGGFVMDHGPNDDILASCKRDDKGHYITDDGNNIVPTAEYYVLLVDKESGQVTPYVLSMSGAQLKHSRKWNTLINTLRVPNPRGGFFNPAMFFRAYSLTTAPESNDQGNWFAWNIKGDINTIDLPDGDQVYLAARAFREQVLSGAVKASEPRAEGPARESDDAPM